MGGRSVRPVERRGVRRRGLPDLHGLEGQPYRLCCPRPSSGLNHPTALTDPCSLPVFWCTVLYSPVFWCTVLYSPVFWCTVLYSTVFWCTVLYSVLVYCTVQCSGVLCCTVQFWCTKCEKNIAIDNSSKLGYIF